MAKGSKPANPVQAAGRQVSRAGKQVASAGKRTQLFGKRYSASAAAEYAHDLAEYKRLSKKLAKAGLIKAPAKKPSSAITRAIKMFSGVLTGEQKSVKVRKGEKSALKRLGIKVRNNRAILEADQRVTKRKGKVHLKSKSIGQTRVVRRISARRYGATLNDAIEGAFDDIADEDGMFIATTIGGYKSYEIYDDPEALAMTLETYRAVRERRDVEIVIIALPTQAAFAWQRDGQRRLEENIAGQKDRISRARRRARERKRRAKNKGR